MGIHYHTGLMENITANHIGRLTSHTGQSNQILDFFRDLSIELFTQCLAAGNDIFRFIMVKASGTDILFQLCQICLGKVSRGLVFLKQIFCYDIDSGIRTLSAEYCSDQ